MSGKKNSFLSLIVGLVPLSLSAAPLQQNPSLTTYFNHADSHSFVEPYRGLTRQGDNFEQPILELIQSATSTIDMAIQEIRLPNVARALVEAKTARGVRVRLVVEDQYDFAARDIDWSRIATFPAREQHRLKQMFRFLDANMDGSLDEREVLDRDAIEILRVQGIPIINDRADGSQGSGLMHHKFLVIDAKYTLVTSANFTLSDFYGDFDAPRTRGNANALVVISDVGVAKNFTAEFDEMFSGHKFGLGKSARPAQRFLLQDGSALTVKFSPDSQRLPYDHSAGGLIAKTLATAKKTISFLLFVFSDQRISNVMEPLFQLQNVQIRGLVEASFAFRPYSELLDMFGVSRLNALCHQERDNRPWVGRVPTEIGVPNLPKGDILHHKFAVVDGRKVLFGSYNWSAAANYTNDETLLVIESPTVASEFEKEVDRIFQGAKLGLPFSRDRLLRCDPNVPEDTHESGEDLKSSFRFSTLSLAP